MRHILTIEYNYARVYVSTLALQAVIERCTNVSFSGRLRQHSTPSDSSGSHAPRTPSGIIPPHTLRRWMEGDRKYIKEIIHGSRDLLSSIIEGLLPNNYLKHAPVRTYFRINAVSMLLLKVCSPFYCCDSSGIPITSARLLRLAPLVTTFPYRSKC